MRESYLRGFVSHLVMKAGLSSQFFLILFCVYARASDILFPGSKDYSQEKPAVFLSLPTEAALCFLGMAASLLQITP